MVLHNGTTQTTERIVNPNSEYLKELPKHIRSFEQALSYWPNQVYIGNKTPGELAAVEQPWCDKTCDVNDRYGKFGQIMLGFTGAVIAFLLQWALYEAVTRGVESSDTLQLISVVNFGQLWVPVAATFLIAGVVIGVGGSLSAIRRFLQV